MGYTVILCLPVHLCGALQKLAVLVHQLLHILKIVRKALNLVGKGQIIGALPGRAHIVHLGEKVAVLGLGSYYQLGEEVVRLLEQEKGIDATLINPRFITGLDEALLDDLKKRHTLVVTLEDGVLDGGFGEKIARYYGPSEMKVLNYGVRKEFIDRFDVSEQLLKNRLTAPQIVEDICACTSFAG